MSYGRGFSKDIIKVTLRDVSVGFNEIPEELSQICPQGLS